jgi:hypothetical protein
MEPTELQVQMEQMVRQVQVGLMEQADLQVQAEVRVLDLILSQHQQPADY